MTIVTVSGAEIPVTRGTTLTYQKLGTAGARRWHVVYMSRKRELKLPVRDVAYIRAGNRKIG